MDMHLIRVEQSRRFDGGSACEAGVAMLRALVQAVSVVVWALMPCVPPTMEVGGPCLDTPL